MAQPELDRLLISNLADLEAAAQHLKVHVMPAVAHAMNESAIEVVERNGWFGIAEYDTGELWLAPREWHIEGGKDSAYSAWFQLDVSDTDWENVQFWLACIAGVGPKQMGMRWSQDAVKPKIWRKHMAGQAETISKLRSRGFDYHEHLGSFFAPVRLDIGALTNAVGDESPELALAPFDDALRRCVDAAADFEALRQSALEE